MRKRDKCIRGRSSNFTIFLFLIVTGLNVTFKNATQTGTTIHSRLDENKDMVKPTPAPINQQTGIDSVFLLQSVC